MQNMIEQEAFAYYKEGVTTWIYYREGQAGEGQNTGWTGQESLCDSVQNQKQHFAGIAAVSAAYQGEAWRATAAEKSYEGVAAEYRDTG
ncbi:hypothetical protein JQN58_09110 [Aneurinibacillus sp. BA2021]|nr:hypothetical protein [Aneurinibacillus sp. BA2021]